MSLKHVHSVHHLKCEYKATVLRGKDGVGGVRRHLTFRMGTWNVWRAVAGPGSGVEAASQPSTEAGIRGRLRTGPRGGPWWPGEGAIEGTRRHRMGEGMAQWDSGSVGAGGGWGRAHFAPGRSEMHVFPLEIRVPMRPGLERLIGHGQCP